MYTSDWHIHSEASYDARKSERFVPIPELLKAAHAQGITRLGITDHANYNTASFLSDVRMSKRLYEQHRCEGFFLGVELTPIAKTKYDYAAKYGTTDGCPDEASDRPSEIALALTLEEMTDLGIHYAVGAAHWSLNVPAEQEKLIHEWHRQQMFLACDPRINILGHPWWYGKNWSSLPPQLNGLWFKDFDIVPASMHDELAAALREHNCRVELNYFMIHPNDYEYGDRFRRQYLEYMRGLFEKGVKITYGSDNHHAPYEDHHSESSPC